MKGDYDLCEFCGAEMAVGATFCRECGASDDSGWNDEYDEDYEGDEYDEEEEDAREYEDFIRREFPDHAESPGGNLKFGFWGIVALVVVAAIALPYLLMLMSFF